MIKLRKLALLASLAIPLAFSSCSLMSMFNNMGTDTLNISKETSLALMDRLAANEGYEITFTFNGASEGNIDKGTGIVGAKNGWQWVKMDGTQDGSSVKEGYARGTVGGTTVYLTWDGTTWSVSTYDSSYSGQGISSSEVSEFLYLANEMDGMLKKNGSKTVAGRSCTDYKGGVDMGSGLIGMIGKMSGADSDFGAVSYKYEYAVDDEYGITMYATMTANGGGEKSDIYYEVTSFKTGVSVLIPTYSN